MIVKRKVAVFDFDGTLTTKDTLLEFTKFSCGIKTFYFGFFLYSPLIFLMKLHLYPNWKCKQKVFSFFFKGMLYSDFKRLGEAFSYEVCKIQNLPVVDKLKLLQSEGVLIYVVSASVEEWVRPFCHTLCVENVLGTKIEVDSNGVITGNFLTKNCYGIEKVNRLLKIEPLRSEYYLYAYGDSRGDKEMLAFADEGFLV